jgi:beta-carotene hydroxylase
MDQPAARIQVDRSWVGAPDSALLGNPTVWLFVVAAATLTLTTVFHLRGALGVVPTVALNALAIYFMFTVMHDAMHRTAHRSSFANAMLGRFSAFTLTVTLPLFRAVHYEHHSHTNEPDRDPDLGVSRRPRALVPLWCLGMIVEYRVHFYRRKLWRTKRDLAETLLMETFLVAAFVVSIATGTFGVLATLWFGPALIAILFLALTFDFLPHYPYDSRERFLDTRIYPGRVLNVVLLGQNYHLIHHLWTTIPWYRYQHVFRTIRPQLEARGSRIGWTVEPLERP